MTKIAKKKKRLFTPEFKADAVRLCESGTRSIAQVAADVGLSESALRRWVKGAEAAAGPRLGDTLTTAEREELSQLRRDNKRLVMERDILKKAAAFFAKENA